MTWLVAGFLVSPMKLFFHWFRTGQQYNVSLYWEGQLIYTLYE